MADAPLEGLLDAAIPVLSNGWIIRLLESGKINIDPFDADRLGPTAYRLTSHVIRFYFHDEEGLISAPEVLRLDTEDGRELRPGEYGVISPRERISLNEGFVADFYPSSWCIENNLLVTAGRLDAGYSADLVFGIFNAGRANVLLSSKLQLIRATFGWLGSHNIPIYTGTPPGAYIPQMENLRKREAELDEAEEHIRQQRLEISRLRTELIGKS